jgi:hypothetical protein
VPAHGEATAGFNEEDSHIIFRIVGWIQDAATHHIVSSRLKHQSFPDPIEFPHKMLPFFAHVVPL